MRRTKMHRFVQGAWKFTMKRPLRRNKVQLRAMGGRMHKSPAFWKRAASSPPTCLRILQIVARIRHAPAHTRAHAAPVHLNPHRM